MIDDILAELEAEGTVESEGHFTLDRGKAREKMVRFQLADPRAYVLELVQAAVLRGAERIRFDVDSRDMQMVFDGRAFTTDDFEDIYGAVFTRQLDHDLLARRQLALGINSAMALQPTQLTVESSDGQQGARLRMTPGHDDVYEAIETELSGTIIRMRERFALGTFVAFFKNIAGTLVEEVLLRERACYASLRLDLEGDLLGHGLNLGGWEVIDSIEVETEGSTIVCGLCPETVEPPLMRLVKDGVWIVDHPLPEETYPNGFVAVVQEHGLRKDVSQSDIVRDEAYGMMLMRLTHGLDRVLASLAQRFVDGETYPWRDWGLTVLYQQIHNLAVGALLDDVDEPSGLVRTLRAAPLWQTTDGQVLTLEDLFAEVEQRGSLAYVVLSRYEGMTLPEHGFVLYVTPGRVVHHAVAALRAIFDAQLREVSGVFAKLALREHAKKAWRSRPTSPVLPQRAYLARRTFSGPGVQGEVGIDASSTEWSRVSYVVQGCTLCEHTIELPLPGLRIVVAAEAFEPSSTYDGILSSGPACEAVLRALTVVPDLYAELARVVEPNPWVLHCGWRMVEAALGETSIADALGEALGFTEVCRAEALARLQPPPRITLDLGTDAPHPVAELPLIPTLGKGSLSLAELLRRAEAGERFAVVPEHVAEVEADVLVIFPGRRELLEPLVPGGFDDGTPLIELALARKRFLERPPAAVPVAVDPPAVLVPIEGEGITGMLRIGPWRGHLTRRRTIHVLHERRAIDELQLLMVGECEGWVESSAVHPRPDYQGVLPAGLDEVRAAVLRAFARGCLQIAEQSRGTPLPDVRAFLQEVATLVFPSRALRHAYAALARDPQIDAATLGRTYRRFYGELHTTSELTEFAHRLWRLSKSKTPAADAMALPAPENPARWALAAIDILFPPGGEPDDYTRRSLEPAAPLAAAATLQRHDGRAVTIADLRAHPTAAPIYHVEGVEPLDLGARLVLVADEITVKQLRRLLGDRLHAGHELVERERSRKALEAKPRVGRIALRPGRALVRVPLQVSAGGQDTRGEVGLAQEHPANLAQSPRVTVVAHSRRRRLDEVTVDDRAIELVAAVDDNRLELGADLTAIERNEAFDEVLRRCELVVPVLIETLCGQWNSMTESARRTAWLHLLDFLAAHPPEAPEGWLALPVGTPLERAARIPGFRTVGGPPRSLHQLAEQVSRHPIEVVSAPPQMWGDSPFGPERPVLSVDLYEQARLEQLLGPVTSLANDWFALKEREKKRARAPEARLPEPADSLVLVSLGSSLLRGRIAIPADGDDMSIELCVDGRVLAVHPRLDDVLACKGSVSGTGIQADPTWSLAALDDEGMAALRDASLDLYRALGRWFRDNPRAERRRWVAARLSTAVVHLRAREQAHALGVAEERLLGELRALPVLEVGGGRRISLDVALQELPDALAPLGLWNPHTGRPAPSPTQRRIPPPVPPPPQPARLTPEQRLLHDVRAELSLVRDRNRALLSNVQLDRLLIEPLARRQRALVAHASAKGCIINRDHPVVQRALAEGKGDPVWCSYVSSAAYTAINVWLEEVTDRDEMHFLHHLGQLVGTGERGEAPTAGR